MITIPFKDWTLKVDREATVAAYAAVTNGSAGDCDCADCKNYSASRDNIFPLFVKSLLAQLGIDCNKESEVWKIDRDVDGLHLYNGFFHFKGSFEGKDCAIPMEGGNGFTFSMTPIDNQMSIGFWMSNSLSYFENKEDVVQVEFEVKLPWVIDKALESETS